MSRLDEITLDVMTGIVPAIHVFACCTKGVDGRHRAGHDDRSGEIPMKALRFSAVAAALAAVVAAAIPSPASAQAREKCVIAWSHYTGWEPLDYMKASGLLKKW